MLRRWFLALGAAAGLLGAAANAVAQSDPLPSWNDNAPKTAIIEVVARTTVADGAYLVPVDRFAMFDNDGALQRPYVELIYQPMLELPAFTRANQFKTFIVSGGGGAFMRPWTEKVHGIPPEQVVDSSGIVKFELGLVHHTDAVREFADDCQSRIGNFGESLDEAVQGIGRWLT